MLLGCVGGQVALARQILILALYKMRDLGTWLLFFVCRCGRGSLPIVRRVRAKLVLLNDVAAVAMATNQV